MIHLLVMSAHTKFLKQTVVISEQGGQNFFIYYIEKKVLTWWGKKQLQYMKIEKQVQSWAKTSKYIVQRPCSLNRQYRVITSVNNQIWIYFMCSNDENMTFEQGSSLTLLFFSSNTNEFHGPKGKRTFMPHLQSILVQK